MTILKPTGIPPSISRNRAILAAPTTNAMERSSPPISAQRAWPIVAIPRNDAIRRLARRLSSDQKPLTVAEPSTTRTINITPAIVALPW